jgi:hypothetical protein
MANQKELGVNIKPVRMNSLWKAYDDSILILSDADCNLSIVTLNRIASHIWLLCNGSNTVADMIEQIKKNSRNAPSENIIIKDVFSLIQSLEEKKLLAW